MYGLKKDVDLSFLLQRRLAEVHVSTHNLLLKFDPPAEINAESAVLLSNQGSHVIKWEYGRADVEPQFKQLIGEMVTGLQCEPSGTLEVSFSDGSKITLLDDSKDYESYTVSVLGLTVVV